MMSPPMGVSISTLPCRSFSRMHSPTNGSGSNTSIFTSFVGSPVLDDVLDDTTLDSELVLVFVVSPPPLNGALVPSLEATSLPSDFGAHASSVITDIATHRIGSSVPRNGTLGFHD